MDRKYYFWLVFLLVQYSNCTLDENGQAFHVNVITAADGNGQGFDVNVVNAPDQNDQKLDANVVNDVEKIVSTPVTVVRTNRNRVTVKLNTNKMLPVIRRRLIKKAIMMERDNFYSCDQNQNDNSCKYSIISTEEDFKLNEILFNGNSIYIGESHSEDFNIFVNISRPDRTVTFPERIRLNETLIEIRQKLRSQNLMAENEVFYQRRTSSDESHQYSPISADDEGQTTLKDILFDGTVRVEISSMDITIKTNYMRNAPISFRIDISFIDQPLDKVRQNWLQSQRMHESDYFYKQENGTEILIRRDDESLYTLKDITHNKSVLIGMVEDDKSKDLEVVTGTVTTNFMKGFTVENTGSWRLTPKTLATLRGPVDVMDSQNSTVLESFFASSQEKLSRMTQGVSETSLSLSASYMVVEVSAGYEQKKENKDTSSASSQMSYCISRMVCQRKEIDIDPARLTIHPNFYRSIRDAIYPGRIEIQYARKLVQVLNEYGWYLPKRYVLGGAKYSIKETSAKSEAEGKEESKSYTASVNFGVNVGQFGANFGAKHSEGSQSSSNTERQSERSSDQTLTIGGDGQQDYNSFIAALSDPKHWRIIKYETFIPSLSLLVGYDNLVFVRCIKLLTEFYAHSPIKNLQRIIDIRDYALQLEIQYSY